MLYASMCEACTKAALRNDRSPAVMTTMALPTLTNRTAYVRQSRGCIGMVEMGMVDCQNPGVACFVDSDDVKTFSCPNQPLLPFKPPTDLLSSHSKVDAVVVRRGWNALTSSQRDVVDELLALPNCTVEPLIRDVAATDSSIELFDDDWATNWEDNWESDWREYLIDYPEIAFSFKTRMTGADKKR